MSEIREYLATQGEPESRVAERLEGAFGHVLQIPAYAEGDTLFATLGSVPAGPRGQVLIVLVLNARADAPQSAREANDATRVRLAAAAGAQAPLSSDPPITAYGFPHGRVVLIDRSAKESFLPRGQGVGLARKIGCDFALALAANGRLASDWIHATDADVLLPNDYFDQTDGQDGSAVAAVYAFRHRFDAAEALGLAGRLYELKLRYDVLGLAWAGSPYAYQALGSCLAVRPAAYAAVGGFPRLNALEDVHMLNSLAKLGSIERLAGAPVELEGRVSDRVPVSTGQTLANLSGKKRALAAFRLDHPLAFAHLAAWLDALEAVARSGDPADALASVPKNNPFFLTELLAGALEEMGAFAAVREAAAESDPAERRRQLHAWFDALKTRRLLTALAQGLPAMPWRQALFEAPFTGLSGSTQDDLDTLLAQLTAQERILAASPAGLEAAPRGRR